MCEYNEISRLRQICNTSHLTMDFVDFLSTELGDSALTVIEKYIQQGRPTTRVDVLKLASPKGHF